MQENNFDEIEFQDVFFKLKDWKNALMIGNFPPGL